MIGARTAASIIVSVICVPISSICQRAARRHHQKPRLYSRLPCICVCAHRSLRAEYGVSYFGVSLILVSFYSTSMLVHRNVCITKFSMATVFDLSDRSKFQYVMLNSSHGTGLADSFHSDLVWTNTHIVMHSRTRNITTECTTTATTMAKSRILETDDPEHVRSYSGDQHQNSRTIVRLNARGAGL